MNFVSKAILFIGVFHTFICQSQVTFTDISSTSGIDYQGKSYGMSWGDVNNDGLLDFYASGHHKISDNNLGGIFLEDLPYIYINQGDNTFSRDTYNVNFESSTDLHGAIFFDFDNNGLSDFIATSGGSQANLFYVNNGENNFAEVNRSGEFGIDQLFGRGRSATCLDIDKNGITDLLIHNLANPDGISPPSIFTRQENEPFVNDNAQRNWSEPSTTCGTLSDIDGDNHAELLVLGDILKIFNYDSGIFEEMQALDFNRVVDFVVEDFNGDQLPDIYLALMSEIADYVQIDPNTIQVSLVDNPNFEYSEFTFETSDSIYFKIMPRNGFFQPFTLHLGESIIEDLSGFTTLALPSNDIQHDGIQAIDPDLTGHHMYLGRINENTWKFVSRSGPSASRAALSVKAVQEITNFNPIIPPYNYNSVQDRLFVNQGNYQFTSITTAPFDAQEMTQSVVAADFDNDMDLDIYVQRSEGAHNSANFLLENTGGTFVRHDGAWGASGDGPGIGESVTVADINNDGFMDIFTSNGMKIFFLEEAGYQLYLNEGNSNNWLRLELEGTESTPEGFGAVVHAYAGGVHQVRTKNAGEHDRCQNDNRIHFGMGTNQIVDSVIVYWPCGTVQAAYNIAVNQTHAIIEACAPVSTETINKKELLQVYPNPSDQSLSIVLEKQESGTFKLANAAGMEVMRGPLEINRTEINTASLAAGVYMLTVQSGKSTFKRKVVIQH